MAKGKASVNYLGRAGLVSMRDIPDYDFLYKTSLTIDPKWAIGDQLVLPDGREYRYAKSAAACISGQGCEFTDTGFVAYTAFTTAAAVDAREVSVPAATHDAITEDELRGGYAVIYDGSTNNVQFRGIIGNAASAADVAFTLYLDGTLTEAVTTSSAIEIYENPYSALQTAKTTTLPKAGVPAAKVSAASTFFWVQKNGPAWAAPQTKVGENGGLGCFWKHDGSLESADTALAVTTATYDTSQYAGHTLAGTAAGNGPLFMLQG